MKIKIATLIVMITNLPYANTGPIERFNKTKTKDIVYKNTHKPEELNRRVFASVGADDSCDFNSIQDAIDSNIAEIRVANNKVYTEQLQLNSNDISIRGGYLDCIQTLSDNQTSVQSVIDYTGVNSGAIIEIVDIVQRNSITIENFRLTGSNLGGILTVSANSEITLKNVLIDNNQRPLDTIGGAGIAVFVGDTDIQLIDSIITNNTAGTGGGIYCSGSEASFTIDGESGVSINKALGTNQNSDSGKGGGMFITNGCVVRMYSGTENVNPQTLIGISGNQANTDGGGFYVSQGSVVSLSGHRSSPNGGVDFYGDDTKPVNLNDNVSDLLNSGTGSGGGAYITGIDSALVITGGIIANNISSNGGGIVTHMGAIVYATRLQKDCWDLVRCNFFQNNVAKNNGKGGAIYSFFFGEMLITNSYFEDNQAGLGTAIFLKDSGSSSDNRVDVSVFNHNSKASNGLDDKHVISLEQASIEISHSTFADNDVQEAVIGLDINSGLRLVTSIVHEATGLVATAPINGSIVAGCVMVHDTTNIPLSLVADPEFVDRINRDYHLNVDLSPAIDMCLGINDSVFKDIDFDERNWDYPGIDNTFGNPMSFSDAGADEVYDIIFMNGFE